MRWFVASFSYLLRHPRIFGKSSLALFAFLALFAAGAMGADSEATESNLAVVHVGADGASVKIFRGELGQQAIDVVSKCGHPSAGAPRIREYTVSDHQVTITYGERSHVNLDLDSGTVECAPD